MERLILWNYEKGFSAAAVRYSDGCDRNSRGNGLTIAAKEETIGNLFAVHAKTL
jgi:hypothetical protein